MPTSCPADGTAVWKTFNDVGPAFTIEVSALLLFQENATRVAIQLFHAEVRRMEKPSPPMFVWTKFALAPDKNAVATQTRQQLMRASEQSAKNPTARFYLGRVERILGREREALSHFHPLSTEQSVAHPSLAVVLPSSQASEPVAWPSPQMSSGA